MAGVLKKSPSEVAFFPCTSGMEEEMLAPTKGERDDDEITDVTEAAKRLGVGPDAIEIDEVIQLEAPAAESSSGSANASIDAAAVAACGEDLKLGEETVMGALGDSSGNTGGLEHSPQQSDSDSFSSDCDEEEKKALRQQYAMGRDKKKRAKIPVPKAVYQSEDIREKKKKAKPKSQLSPLDEASQLSSLDEAEISTLARIDEKLASICGSESEVNTSLSANLVKTPTPVPARLRESGHDKRQGKEDDELQKAANLPDSLTDTIFSQVPTEPSRAGLQGAGGQLQRGVLAPKSKIGPSESVSAASQILAGVEDQLESNGGVKSTHETQAESVFSDISSDESDSTIVEVEAVKRVAAVTTKVKSEAQRAAIAERRRRRKRARDKALLKAAQGDVAQPAVAERRENIPPVPHAAPQPAVVQGSDDLPLVPKPQAQKRKLAPLKTSGPKQSKPSSTSAVTLCDQWLDGGSPSDLNPGDDLIDRHGPVTFQELSHFSSVRRGLGGRNEVTWEGPNSPSPLIQPNQPHGLRLHVLGNDGLVTPVPAAVESAVRRGEAPADCFCVHSTRIIEMQRSIDLDSTPACSICSHPHMSKPAVLNVLVCSSEAVASVGIPQVITASGIPQAKLPEFLPRECFEVLLICGDLEASPRDVIDRVYGKCRVPINFILNLGGDVVMQGESAKSVFNDLMGLRGFLLREFRRSLRVPTRVFLTSPLQWAGEEHLHLGSHPQGPLTYSQRCELYSLARQIEAHNDSLVTDSVSLRHMLPRWYEFVTFRKESVVPGNFGRVRTIVSPSAKASVVAAADGNLHLDKKALLLLVKSTFTFMKRLDSAW